jgi:hypothetical protein
MGQYKKLIVAVLGVAALLLNKYVGIDIGPHSDVIADALVAVLTAFGVFAATNAKPDETK